MKSRRLLTKKNDKTRRKIIAVFISIIAIIVLFLFSNIKQQLPNESYVYYLANAFNETGAKNIVSAIYLNYRVYDTIFESCMLLIAIIAIIHFSMHEGGE
jgi:multisubunit Na+/H+ antiporter MnhB subunit